MFVELVVLFLFLIGDDIISLTIKKILKLKPRLSPFSKNYIKCQHEHENETINIENQTLSEHTHTKSLPI